jgi:putative ABC transport system ATP-binding protein
MRRRKDPHAEWKRDPAEDEQGPAGRSGLVGTAAHQRTVPRPQKLTEGLRVAEPDARSAAVAEGTFPSAPLLSGEDLVRSYPGAQRVAALRGVSLTIRPGEFVALVGPSGSGKTTLLGLLSGLDAPERGRVAWRGRPMEQLRDEEVRRLRRRGVGVVFQSFGLLPSLSAVENVALPLRVAGVDPQAAARAGEGWLRRLGMGDRFDNRVFELSAGQQQRVAIARALVIEPDVVLADEPIAEVDSGNATVILEALAEVSGRGGAVVCATHNPAALSVATRAVLLRDGTIEAEGSPAEVATRLTTD